MFKMNHLLAAALMLAVVSPALRADDDMLGDLLKNAPAAKTPAGAPETSPAPPSTQPWKIPSYARKGTVELNSGKKLAGPIWTTMQTPLRFWQEENKTYRDLDFSILRSVEVVVRSATMEPDWRWLKEGSDQKVYSGKHYPMVDLAYRATLVNGQTIEGTVVAPIFIYDGTKPRNLALYKKYKGTLEETLTDVTYIKQMTFDAAPAAAPPSDKTTTKLPLIID